MWAKDDPFYFKINYKYPWSKKKKKQNTYPCSNFLRQWQNKWDIFVMYLVIRTVTEQENMTVLKTITEMSQKKFALLLEADVQALVPRWTGKVFRTGAGQPSPQSNTQNCLSRIHFSFYLLHAQCIFLFQNNFNTYRRKRESIKMLS